MFCLITDPIYSIESSYNLYLHSTITSFLRLYLYTVLRLVYLVFKKLFSTSFAFAFSVSLRLIIIYSPSKELASLASRFGTFLSSLSVAWRLFQSFKPEIASGFFPCSFWDCKGRNLFLFSKTYFFYFSKSRPRVIPLSFLLLLPALPLFSSLFQNTPLLRLRAAKVSRVLVSANACLRKSISVLITLCKSAGKNFN